MKEQALRGDVADLNSEALKRCELPGIEEWASKLLEVHGSPLLVLDCDRVRRQYRDLARSLPGVDLHYAVKALMHPAVIATLSEEGSGFDVATAAEIRALGRFGIGSGRVIHTHPIKGDRDICESLAFGCNSFVVDNPDEMKKFVPYRNKVVLTLRIGFRSSDAVVDLAKKFGCAPVDAFPLLELGKSLGLEISGLSFHVGSQCSSPGAHVSAIAGCIAIIQRVRRTLLEPIRVLDIGGGFPVSYRNEAMSIGDFCAPIRNAISKVPEGVRCIAEPGRYLVAPAMEAIATVIGKARRNGSFWYYLDDGVYGSFSGHVFDGADYPIVALTNGQGEQHASVLAGPTCDSIDVIAEGVHLPELEVGDLILASSMGAYTSASASEFNSIPKTKILAINPPVGLAANLGGL